MGADTRENVDHLVKDLIGHTLSKNNISVQGFVNNPRPTPLEAHVRRTVDALIDDSPELFTNLGEQLHITDENIQHIFVGISDEIFVTGINWGRIVAFLAFGGAVATHCATKEDLKSFVDAVAEWMTEYINANLKQWIEQKGGWVSLTPFKRSVEFFDQV